MKKKLDLDTLGKRLIQSRESLNISRIDFVELFNSHGFRKDLTISLSTIQAWELDQREPSASYIIKLASILNKDLNFLLTGASNIEPYQNEFSFIKGYDIQASAGFGSINYDETPTRHFAFRNKWLKQKNLFVKNLVVIFVKGDSMQPTIFDNDTILVNTANKSLTDGLIYVIRQNQELLVKRLQRLQNGVRLISDNKIYSNIDILSDDLLNFEVIGQVVNISHDL